jgi:hypothetical protein
LNPKWSPKYKNPPIWAKFGFQVDYDVANWYPLFGSHVMILQIISYLVNNVFPSPLLTPFWIQNVHHSKPKWSPYGVACLTSCTYPFPLKSFHFWISNNFFFLYWRPFWKL